MRKRLVIGAIAAVLIGGATYFVWEPGRGTVEYHKKQYLEAKRSTPIAHWIEEAGLERLGDALADFRSSRVEHHRQALVRLGYVEVIAVPVSSAPPWAIWMNVLPRQCLFLPGEQSRRDPRIQNLDYRFFSYAFGTNSITVWCQTEQARTWRDVIRDADLAYRVTP